ncbi:hypothetical protein KHS38_08190 [Mucilaginibacter sp. Bleaf8]|uniref:hypothetical protein n=1 Tax=Mucilaginibacter sp. Bleaf8 TaxID=2834430 RepID=UPI001BD145F8|nr:hypothetical protein [Mucilaginibacter sp. Bleaf8]MBS7564384.1 hypothetical protein [Mucilaginibacter sp. Bleaf8]
MPYIVHAVRHPLNVAKVFIIKAVGLLVAVACLLSYNSNYETEGKVFCVALPLLWFIYQYVVLFRVGLMRSMEAGEDGLIISYYFISIRHLIPYTDMEAIHTLRTRVMRDSIAGSYQQQEIELTNGATVKYNENHFSNYTELKVAIWQNRLAAFEALRVS